MRLAEWNRAGNRRRDMRGLVSTAGIDKMATVEAAKAQNQREVLSGCNWTKTQQFVCHRADTPMCLFCGEEPEDEDHTLWLPAVGGSSP